MTKLIKLNVGGGRFTTSHATLNKYPDSIFADMITDSWEQKDEKGRYFIDRDSGMFKHVLHYMRTDEIPDDVSPIKFHKELEYYGIVIEGIEQEIVEIGTKFCKCYYRNGVSKDCKIFRHTSFFKLQELLEKGWKIHYSHGISSDEAEFILLKSNKKTVNKKRSRNVTIIPICLKNEKLDYNRFVFNMSSSRPCHVSDARYRDLLNTLNSSRKTFLEMVYNDAEILYKSPVSFIQKSNSNGDVNAVWMIFAQDI